MRVLEWRVRGEEPAGGEELEIYRSVSHYHGPVFEVHGPVGFAERARAAASPFVPGVYDTELSSGAGMGLSWEPPPPGLSACLLEYLPGVFLADVLRVAPQLSYPAAVALAHDLQTGLDALERTRPAGVLSVLSLSPRTVRIGFRGGLAVFPLLRSALPSHASDDPTIVVPLERWPRWTSAVVGRAASTTTGFRVLKRLVVGGGGAALSAEARTVRIDAAAGDALDELLASSGGDEGRFEKTAFLRSLVDLEDARIALSAHVCAAFPQAREEQLAFLADADSARGTAPLVARSDAQRVTGRMLWADRHPVSRGEFEVFLASTGYERPPRYPMRGASTQPATFVSHADAAAFARWKRGRLPTRAEWLAVVGEWWCAYRGNLWEWTADAAHRGHVVCGGRWRDRRAPGAPGNCSWEDGAAPDLGFRLVYDGDPNAAP